MSKQAMCVSPSDIMRQILSTLTILFLPWQKTTAPLIPNEHTPDEAKPSIAIAQKTSASMPKEEKPSSPRDLSPKTGPAPIVVKESAH